MFRRRRSSDDADPDAMPEENEAEAATGSAAVADGSHGPWDSADAPDDGTARVDLGSLHVPVVDGMEVRVDMQDQHVVAATLVDGNSTMQVHAFAAPKSSGIWAEVREEIAASIREGGGSADEAAGELGPELRARVPAQPGGQFAAMQSLRFIGVDGPRWFLRGLLTGPAATDDVQARRLFEAFRGTVVDRGQDAMAPREMLPLRLPKEAAAHQPPAAARPGLEILERGPEITETR